jgi:hypothetical protein
MNRLDVLLARDTHAANHREGRPVQLYLDFFTFEAKSSIRLAIKPATAVNWTRSYAKMAWR